MNIKKKEQYRTLHFLLVITTTIRPRVNAMIPI